MEEEDNGGTKGSGKQKLDASFMVVQKKRRQLAMLGSGVATPPQRGSMVASAPRQLQAIAGHLMDTAVAISKAVVDIFGVSEESVTVIAAHEDTRVDAVSARQTAFVCISLCFTPCTFTHATRAKSAQPHATPVRASSTRDALLTLAAIACDLTPLRSCTGGDRASRDAQQRR